MFSSMPPCARGRSIRKSPAKIEPGARGDGSTRADGIAACRLSRRVDRDSQYEMGVPRSVGWLLGVNAASCASPMPAEEGEVRPSSTQTVSIPPPASVAVASSVAPPPTIPAATPDRIQCGTTQCALGSEVCCLVESDSGKEWLGQCVVNKKGPDGTHPCCKPNPMGHCGHDGLSHARECDEAGDCGGSGRCCSRGRWESDWSQQQCASPDGSCWDETCLPGSTCANGRACQPTGDEVLGRCPLQSKPAACGSKTCALGEACCWDGETKVTRCAAKCDARAEATFECTGPEQCAPYDCNAFSASPPARFSCGGEGFVDRVLCRTKADCPEQIGAQGYGAMAPRIKACEPSDMVPSGLKECIYE